MASPKSLRIRTYHVGFGDCFLLSFNYAGDSKKHVLIDFGSTGMPDDMGESSSSRMIRVAKNIEEQTKGKLTAIVATHRHKDHISGFATQKDGRGPGDVIRALKPALVLQPWTEDPKLATDATGPGKRPRKNSNTARVAALRAMNDAAVHLTRAATGKQNRQLLPAVREQMAFIGEDNIQNASAVNNLMTMGKNEYLHAGRKSGLERLLPGVRINVLGPPTVDQSSAVTKMRSSDPNEFWQFQSKALADVAARGRNGSTALFPKHVLSSGPQFPVNARWFVSHARGVRGNQLLEIVRALDDTMNNTSLILLLRAGKKSLLFPGDAQIENWSYALSRKTYKALLAKTSLYKVGHHGSRNATPISLWDLFENRSPTASAQRLISLMSTMEGKHGTEAKKTEVPRISLTQALKRETDLVSTHLRKSTDLFTDTVMTF